MRDYAPVVLFVYNRPVHTEKTLSALMDNVLAAESELFIFADGPKNTTDKVKTDAVRKYIDSIGDMNAFKDVTIYKSDVNQGLANSIINGVSRIIDKFGRVIVVEDDLVTAKDFLIYMNGALDYYAPKEKIWSISGYTMELKKVKDYEEDVYLSYRACSCGWGTWKNRWDTIDWACKDYGTLTYKVFYKFRFQRGGKDLPAMLKHQMTEGLDSWAIRWCYNQCKQNKLTIYPRENRVYNIGMDGSGVHSVSSDYYNHSLYDGNKACVFRDIKINGVISKQFYYHYSPSVMVCVKRFIKKVLGTIKGVLK